MKKNRSFIQYPCFVVVVVVVVVLAVAAGAGNSGSGATPRHLVFWHLSFLLVDHRALRSVLPWRRSRANVATSTEWMYKTCGKM